ncbi:MAG: glycoside hydrolase family 3 C-terminal domain-containing protein [Prevotella sp.]|nr:glycoside hydrolase family 3 C-terminal domain-containing protein [Prevotella sp.]
MKRTLLLPLLLIAALSIGAQPLLPYQNPNLSPEERADDLLSRLTLEEKASLMMNGSPAIPRLGIPQFEWWSEALHGIGRNGFATVYPITTAMAASFDEPLLYQVFSAVGDEGRAKAEQAKRAGNVKRYQGLSFWTPNINIFRDPRWGRGQETYGEDPYLTARLGTAVVRGLQGTSTPIPSRREGRQTTSSTAGGGYLKLLACAKHFAIHSGPEWNRHTFNIEQLPERDLWETYLPAFKALVQEGNVAEVMCAYQRVDGEPCCGQARLEQHILRDEWGFRGLITSDCGAINDFYVPGRHEVSADAAAASAKAVRSGTDVECGGSYRHLPEAVRRGDLSEADIDRSLRRLIIARIAVGDFDPDSLVPWTRIPDSVICSPQHKQLALQMARESIVLLKNNGILPLPTPINSRREERQASPSAGTSQAPLPSGGDGAGLVVMGPNANDSTMMWGNYTGYPTQTITILQGIRQLTGQDIRYIPGCGLTRGEVNESRFGLLHTPDGQRGMRATYWNNTEWEGEPAATAVFTEPINQSNGGATVFAPGVNLEHFSARYEGWFTPTEDETLTLREGSDDKVRIILNGDTIIRQWQSRHRIDYRQKEIRFRAGQRYNIQIDYVQLEDMAAMQFDLFRKTTPTAEQIIAEVGDAQTVVFVGGISPQLEGEEMRVDEPGFRGGDRTDIELPQAQRTLLRALHDAGKHIVFINCSGGAIAMVPELETCDAIIQGWYGGERGGQAMAEVLFGRCNPSGKLPMTFYRSTDDLPDFLDYRMANRTYRYFRGQPLFPFGYGLSYTSFFIGQPSYKNGRVYVNVTNTGSTDGTEVVQVYVRNTADRKGPLKSLRAFERVSLKAGETRTVAIDFPRERFEGWDVRTNTVRVVPGRYELMVGSSSADADLKRTKVTVK